MKKLTKQEAEYRTKMNQNFEVKGICRLDLIEYIGKKKAMEIGDAQMNYIAGKLGDALQENYWISLGVILDWSKDEIDRWK